MDARTKRILCESVEEDLILLFEDEYVKYYRGNETCKAYAVITSSYCRSIPSKFTTEKHFSDIPIEWTVVGVCSIVKATSRDKRIVSLPASVEYIAMEGKYGCYNFLFEVDEDNPYYKSKIFSSYPACGVVFSKDGTELLSAGLQTPDHSVFHGVNKIGDISIENECDKFNIPSYIEAINSAHLKCKSIRFEGDLPKLGYISNMYAEKIYVNCPLKYLSKDGYEKISNLLTEDEGFKARVITKKPELSTETPAAPGFIGLTRVDNDEYEYVNPRYIIKMEPVSFEKYDGIETGTRVLYAAHGTQQAISVDYYEKLLDVDRKIKEAQEALAKSIGGLAGLLDVVKDMYETSQMEFII